MFIQTPQKFEWCMPIGYQIMLTFGRLNVRGVRTISYGSAGSREERLWMFRPSPGEWQIGQGKYASDGEGSCSEHLEQVHGDGILVTLRRDANANFVIGFWNPSLDAPFGRWMALGSTQRQMEQSKRTNGQIEKPGFFGTRTVPFEHYFESLDRLHWDLMSYCDEHGEFRGRWEAYVDHVQSLHGRGNHGGSL